MISFRQSAFPGGSAVVLILACSGLWGGATSVQAFDLQGHRGARGLLPENSLPAFARALTLGVTTLELDVGLSADGHLMASHDPRLNPDLTRGPDGKWLASPGPTLFSLELAELRTYDVGRIDPGSRYASRFPAQRPLDGTRMPTLAEVFALSERAGNSTVRFNVETKVSPLAPELTAEPRRFADTVVDLAREHGLAHRITVQSFDWRTLARVQARAPEIETVYLSAQQRWLDNIAAGQPGSSPWTAGLDVDDVGGSVPRLVKRAGGAVWSPFYREVDRASLEEARDLGIRVIVWTVNEPKSMHELIALGVDGIITDYPDRLRRVMSAEGMPLPAPTPVTAASGSP
jgi:glycerophosphoryl diester phosphodiesterase